MYEIKIDILSLVFLLEKNKKKLNIYMYIEGINWYKFVIWYSEVYICNKIV